MEVPMMRSATFSIGLAAVALLLTGCADRHTNPAAPNTTQRPSFSRGLEGDEDGADDYADVNASSVTGTLFHRGRYNSASKVILLNHGTASNRGFWDGGAAGDASPQITRLLARAGYVVITYDRLGFGQSVYAGDPRTLTQFNSVLMMHQGITQVRTGTFTRPRAPEDDQPAAACPTGTQARFGMPTVILGGHSSGGVQALNYATRYHDIAAVIVFNSAGPTTSPAANDVMSRVVGPQE